MVPEQVRLTLIGLSLIFVTIAGYHRIQSQRSGERLDRTKEGWPIMIGMRLMGILTLGSTVAWLWNPAWFAWASFPVPLPLRWLGVAGFAGAVAWLIWMFHTLGRNLTDTVIVRRNAYFVDTGPYRIVRNPMYLGILKAGITLGLALGTWLLPVAGTLMFTLLAIRTRTEERFLIERFGDTYRNYMRRVGRFIPRLPI